MSKVPMTVRGHELLQEELKKLKYEDRPNVVKAIAEARGHGDLKENAEYHAAKVMVGESLAKQGFVNQRVPEYFSVKEAVFPFIKFPGADPILGPEMKSTGEVMGVGRTFGEAYAKAQLASGVILPRQGAALLSVRERDKEGAV